MWLGAHILTPITSPMYFRLLSWSSITFPWLNSTIENARVPLEAVLDKELMTSWKVTMTWTEIFFK